MMVEDRLQSTVDEVNRFEQGHIWADIVALINGRLADVTQRLCSSANTSTIEVVRALQSARAELLQLRDLPELLREELQQQEEGTEDGSGE